MPVMIGGPTLNSILVKTPEEATQQAHTPVVHIPYITAKKLEAEHSNCLFRCLYTKDRGFRHQRAKHWYRYYVPIGLALSSEHTTPATKAYAFEQWKKLSRPNPLFDNASLEQLAHRS